MKSKDITPFYENYKAIHGLQVYKYFSAILAEIKIQHKQDWDEEQKKKKSSEDDEKKEKVFEQSWHSLKGACLEKLIFLFLTDLSKDTLIKFVTDKKLSSKKLKPPLDILKHALLVDYEPIGQYLPDADLIAYIENPPRILAILSIKSSLRERIAQVAYWQLKTSDRNIPYFFITPDNDADFSKEEISKSRAIAETDTTRVYLLTEAQFSETERVRSFEHLVNDLKKLAEG